MRRRSFLMALPAVPLAWALPRQGLAAAAAAQSVAEVQQNWKQLLAPGADVATTTTRISKTETEWQQLLTPAQFKVLRQEGTEVPYSSPLNGEKRAGIFVCAGCALPLFSSQMKYDSGTGWPSFFTLIPERLATKEDRLLM